MLLQKPAKIFGLYIIKMYKKSMIIPIYSISVRLPNSKDPIQAEKNVRRDK